MGFFDRLHFVLRLDALLFFHTDNNEQTKLLLFKRATAFRITCARISQVPDLRNEKKMKNEKKHLEPEKRQRKKLQNNRNRNGKW